MLVGVAVLPNSVWVEEGSKIGELKVLGLERESVELERERPECVIDEIWELMLMLDPVIVLNWFTGLR